ncbi:MAG: hypothetical protein M3R72_08100 [Bacteroidota bacterium]|nr:hypothetical protein [Bacteroidota bacterium]
MPTILFFALPAMFICLMLACYMGIKSFNKQLNEDLATKKVNSTNTLVSSLKDNRKDEIIAELIASVKYLTLADIRNREEIEKLKRGTVIPDKVFATILKRMNTTSNDPYTQESIKMPVPYIRVKTDNLQQRDLHHSLS